MAGHDSNAPTQGPPQPRALDVQVMLTDPTSREGLAKALQDFLIEEASEPEVKEAIDIQVSSSSTLGDLLVLTRQTPSLRGLDSRPTARSDEGAHLPADAPVARTTAVPTLASPPKHRHIGLRERRHTVDNVESMFMDSQSKVPLTPPIPSRLRQSEFDRLHNSTYPGDDPAPAAIVSPGPCRQPVKSAGPSPATSKKKSYTERRGRIGERTSRSMSTVQAPLAARAVRWSNFPDSSANIHRLSSNAEKDRAQFQAGHILPAHMYSNGAIGSNSWGSSPRTTRRMPSIQGNFYHGLRAPSLSGGNTLSPTPTPVSRKRSSICVSNPGLPQPLYIFSTHPRQPRGCGVREPLWRTTHQEFWEDTEDAGDPYLSKYGPYQAQDLTCYLGMHPPLQSRLPGRAGRNPVRVEERLQFG